MHLCFQAETSSSGKPPNLPLEPTGAQRSHHGQAVVGAGGSTAGR